MDASSNSNGLIAMAVWFCLYWLPTFFAYRRRHLNTASIMLLNCFLGWTFIGWVVALIWAASHQAPIVVADKKTETNDRLFSCLRRLI